MWKRGPDEADLADSRNEVEHDLDFLVAVQVLLVATWWAVEHHVIDDLQYQRPDLDYGRPAQSLALCLNGTTGRSRRLNPIVGLDRMH